MPHTSIAAHEDDIDLHFCGFHNLMPYRVQNVLLVSSLYESFILEEEGLLTELITSKYLDMNLSHAPRVSRVSTAKEALKFIEEEPVDLVLTMARLGRWNAVSFAAQVKELRPNLPIVVLAGETRELVQCPELTDCKDIDRVFVWNGDATILLAIIKFVEDQINAEHDTRVGDVRVIILVENSVRFYSTYLPLIYGEVVKLTQSLIDEGINLMQRLLRMRARPKILLAETFEEAWDLYSKYSDHLLGVISDIRFPKNGELVDDAGLDFVRLIRQDSPHVPVLLQSSNAIHSGAAAELHASFLNKYSHSLLRDLRSFLLGNLGFGEFLFSRPDGEVVGQAHDLETFEKTLATVPDESIVFHAQNNHFSNWLMARTEFEMAARIRPRKVTDFDTVADLRSYLLATLAEFRERTQCGVIADFSARRVDIPTAFTRIGGGSIGGKARGLAFMNALIRRHNLSLKFDGVRMGVPSSAAIGTDVFDEFLDTNNLRGLMGSEPDDRSICEAFMKAKLPPAIYSDMRAFLAHVQYPLAVRSSSLLEDSLDQPFAGIYRTHMLPNNHPDLAVRLDQLCDAIKLVYASMLFRGAKRYLESTGRHLEEEKMGVIIQELVGSEHGGRFYPTFSGVARSYNFYPAGQMTPEDGVVCVALGLGKMVVDGGQGLMFCPSLPQVLPQFATIKDMFANSQKTFYALDTSHPDVYPNFDVDANLLQPGLDVAEADGTLAPIGSVYSPENDAVYDGIHRKGPRLVTFAHVLKSDLFPLAEAVELLLTIGREGMASPVEIEFAVDMSRKPMEFGVLQIRPTVSHQEQRDVSLKNLDTTDAICFSEQALGNGRICGVRDVVYVRPDTFDSRNTPQIANAIGGINDELRKAGRKYVLIGPGRWGSADRWLGIPVSWDQISAAQVIIETTLDDFLVTPSQGTHFFQNLTSLGVGYFTVDPSIKQGFVDWDWLGGREATVETEYLRHITMPESLDIRLDGRTRRGAILRPGTRLR